MTLDVPYVSMVVVKKDFGISKSLVKSFNSLAQIIMNGEAQTDSDAIVAIASGLSKYAEEVERRQNAEQDLLKLKNVKSTSPDGRDGNLEAKLLGGVVLSYLESDNRGHRNILDNRVYELYRLPIRSLIMQDPDSGISIPDAAAILQAVEPKSSSRS